MLISRINRFSMAPALTAVLMGSMTVGSAFAHHSAAMFDMTKRLTIKATVKQWQWTNPHAWLQVTAPPLAGGDVVEQGFELGSPNTLIRNGFKATTFKAGDEVTIVYGPRKDGTPGGQLVQVRTADGEWLQWGPGADKAAAEAAGIKSDP